MRAKSSLIVLVCSICMLALLALFFAVAGAWYRAERDGKVEMIFDSGIKFSLSNTDADGNLNYFVDGNELNTSSSNILPLDDIQIEQNATYKVLKPTISAISGTKSFYARAKLVYNFYVYENETFVKKTASQLSGGPTETQTLNTLISQDLTFNSNWLLADDGYYYYSINSSDPVSRNNLQIIDENSSSIEIISGNTLTIGSWETLVGGPYGIDRFEIKLELDVIESSLKSTWNPMSFIEFDSTKYEIRNEYNAVFPSDIYLPENTTLSIVEKSTGYGYTFTHSIKNGICEMSVTGLIDQSINVEILDKFMWNGEKFITTAISTSLAPNASNTYLKSIILPDTIKSLIMAVFSNCTALESVTLPGDISAIPGGAFNGCTSLASITIPNSVTTIGSSAFNGCTSLASITIPSGVTTIELDIFNGCTSLASITIPSSVTSIGNSAFSGCENLETVSFANNSSLTSIGNSAFNGCTSLASIAIPSSVASIGTSAFNGCTALQVTDGDLIYIKNGINNYYALYGVNSSAVESITQANINSNCQIILASAFSGCTNLESVTIPSVVTTIGMDTFNGCTNLTSITIPSSVTSIGDSAFSGCENLETVSFANNSFLTSIGASAFSGCTSLGSISIPSSVTTIGSSAFSGCTSLASITIPSSVTSIGYSAFSGCENLETVSFANNSSLTSIGSSAFNGCTSLANINIPSSITTIGTSAFNGCTALQVTDGDLIYIKNGINNYYALYGVDVSVKESITQANINSNCQIILASAFSGCTNLESVTIPNSVVSILDSVFSGLTSLTTVTFVNNSTLTSIGASVFNGCTSLGSISIPSSVTTIGSSAFGGCTSLASITIPSSVTSIGNNAFFNCTSLANINIPSSVPSIGSYAFSGCTSLANINIPSSVTSIGNYAFNGCTNLTSITIPSSVTSIGNSAFSGCTSLATVTFANNSSLTSIGNSAFENCRALTSITLPNTITTIGDSTFASCINFISFNIQSNIVNIEASAFKYCANLTTFTSDSRLFSVSDDGRLLIKRNEIVAFAQYGITEYVIPNTITSVLGSVFYGCNNITELTFPNNLFAAGEDAFRTNSTIPDIPETTTFYFDGVKSDWKLGTTGDIFGIYGGLGASQVQITIYSKVSSESTTYEDSFKYTTKGGTCLVEGTKVALADGSVKNIEDITYSDLLLAKDLIDGGFSAQYATWVEKVATTNAYTLITFDDGSSLKIVGGHALFDAIKNCFVEYGSEAFPLVVGTKAYKLRTDKDGNLIKDENGNFVSFTSEVVSIETIYEEVNYYHVFSSRQLNLITDGVMTVAAVSPYMNMYGFDEEMRFNKEIREMVLNTPEYQHTYEDYIPYNAPYWLYLGFRGNECKYMGISGIMSEEDWFNFVLTNVFSNDKFALPETAIKVANGQEIEKIVWTVSTSDEFENLFDENYEKTKVFDGDEFTLPEPKEASGKTFIGWKSSVDGKIYEAGDKVQIWLGTHFEAIWQ